MTPYARLIVSIVPKYDPRHIEAFMRLQHSTFDHLSRAEFLRECYIAAGCVDEGGKENAERCAQSFGF